jgi:hypothetical protein
MQVKLRLGNFATIVSQQHNVREQYLFHSLQPALSICKIVYVDVLRFQYDAADLRAR